MLLLIPMILVHFDKWNCKYEVNMFGKMWLTTNIMNIEILYIF